MKLHPAIALLITCTGLIACAPAPVAPTPTATASPAPTPTPRPTLTPTPTEPPLPAFPSVAEHQVLLANGPIDSPDAIARIGIGEFGRPNSYSFGAFLPLGELGTLVGTPAAISLLDPENYELLWTRAVESVPAALSPSPDGTRFVVTYSYEAENTPELYDSATGVLIAELPGWEGGQWSPDGSLVAMQSRPELIGAGWELTDIDILLYDGYTGQLRGRLVIPDLPDIHSEPFGGIVWSPDGSLIVGCMRHQTLLWDAIMTEFQWSYTPGAPQYGCPVFFTESGDQLVRSYNVVAFYDSQSGERLHESFPSDSIGGWDPNRWFVYGFHDTIYVLEPDTWELLNSFEEQENQTVRFDAKAGRVLIYEEELGGRTHTMRVLDPLTGRELFALDKYYLGLSSWSPDGQWLLMKTDLGLRSFDATTGAPLYQPLQTDAAAQFTRDGNMLLRSEQQLQLFEISSGRYLADLHFTIDPFTLAWSGDSRTVIIRNSQGEAWYSSEPFTEVSTTAPADLQIGPSTMVEPLDWDTTRHSPDGHVTVTVHNTGGSADGLLTSIYGLWYGFLTLSRDAVVIYEDSRDERTGYSLGPGVGALAWSPDSQVLAAGSSSAVLTTAENSIRLFDTRTGEVFRTLVGHTRGVEALLFSPDGTRLLSYSEDGTFIIWDLTR